MKKGISILVAAVAIISVVIVAFLGTNPVGIVVFTYINSIEILDTNSNSIPWNDFGQRVLSLDFQADITDTTKGIAYMYYVFDTKINPEIVTKRSFVYYCAEDAYVTFSANGSVDENSSSSVSSSSSGPEIQSNHSGQMLIYRSLLDKAENDHYIDIYCRADDNGKAGVEDTIGLLIHFPEIK
jgi:hypothetical protein